MALKKVNLTCFRNFSQLSFVPSQHNLIVGDNGKGKTNLLEAIFLLSFGRSFRPALPQSFIKKEQKTKTSGSSDLASKKQQAFISAKTTTEEILNLSLSLTGEKNLYVNQKRSTFLKTEPAVIFFGPESLSLLKGSAEQRRSWLDLFLSLRGEKQVVRGFKKALAQKNQLLKKIQKGEIGGEATKKLLTTVNTVFEEKNLSLVQARKRAIEDLSEHLGPAGTEIFKNTEATKKSKKLKLKLCYESSFETKPSESLFKEQKAGVCLYGAQRDDFQLFFNNWDCRFFCSQGQQRGLVLALKGAQVLWYLFAHKKPCIFLLDDVFSEIDQQVILNLLRFLNETPVQTILTSTYVPTCLDTKVFKVFKL